MAVTIKDLAEATGISTSTISRVLSRRGYVDENTRNIVEKAVKEMGYVYNPVKKRRNGIDMVLLLMDDTLSGVYSQNIEGISSVFDTFNIAYACTQGIKGDYQKLENFMMMAIKNRFKGTILLTPVETPGFIRIMKNTSIPCVGINRPISVYDIDQVCMDNKEAGRMAVEYLIQKGHTRIACCNLSITSVGRYRAKGYVAGMQNAGLKIMEGDMIECINSYESGINIGNYIAVAKKDITAIYAPSELIARGVIEGLRRCGKHVPEDYSIVASDETIFSIVSMPNITTVSCNHYMMGAEAAQLFLERCANPLGEKKHLFFKPEIIERDTVRDIRENQQK